MKSWLEKNKKIIKFIKLLVTVSLLIFIFSKIDLNGFLGQLTNINYLILIPLFLYPISLLLSSVKWKIALGNKEEDVFWLSKIYWIAAFFNNFLPSTIGGDVYKFSALKNKYSTKKILASILLDRGTGVVAIFILLAIFFLRVKKFIDIPDVNVSMVFISTIFVILVLLLFYKKIIKNEKVRKFIGLVKNSVHKIVWLLLISIPFIILGAVSMFVYFYMFGYVLNFFDVLVIYIIIQLIGMLPISINGLGVNEASYTFLFLLLGVPIEVSLAIAIVSRVVMLVQTSFGGVFYLVMKKT